MGARRATFLRMQLGATPHEHASDWGAGVRDADALRYASPFCFFFFFLFGGCRSSVAVAAGTGTDATTATGSTR